jgi:hypothetical protein
MKTDDMQAVDDEPSYLRRVEVLAHAVCDRAMDEGWLSYRPDPDEATPLQRAVNELARNLRHHHSSTDGCCD